METTLLSSPLWIKHVLIFQAQSTPSTHTAALPWSRTFAHSSSKAWSPCDFFRANAQIQPSLLCSCLIRKPLALPLLPVVLQLSFAFPSHPLAPFRVQETGPWPNSDTGTALLPLSASIAGIFQAPLTGDLHGEVPACQASRSCGEVCGTSCCPSTYNGD